MIEIKIKKATRSRRHNTVWTITPQGTAPAARYGVFLFYSPFILTAFIYFTNIT